MPFREDVELLETAPEKARAQAYDLVLNGYELGGGSLRIYERDVQEKMFKALGFSQEEAQEQIGFLLEAFEYGTPPHGGIAYRFRPSCYVTCRSYSNLRDTIAFPKTASASCLLTRAQAQLQKHSLKS